METTTVAADLKETSDRLQPKFMTLFLSTENRLQNWNR